MVKMSSDILHHDILECSHQNEGNDFPQNMTESLVQIWENNEILQLRAQLRSKIYECSVWKKRSFQLGQENAKLRNVLHQVLSPLDPIKDIAMVTLCHPQHCPAV
mmetsp:Transcript_56801/g.118789  ORF Transcript_56801/g.118789 Transcript_56801/m.118789 type:complete len:105 (-) Transcript_56801:440-754(-)